MGNSELAHYGVLGMKWGVRRTPEQLARARGKTSGSSQSSRSKSSETKKKSSGSEAKKKLSEMSDDELNKTVKRLQLEQQYRNLNPEKVSLGKRFVNTTLKNVVVPAATEAGKQVLKDEITKALQEALNKSRKTK